MIQVWQNFSDVEVKQQELGMDDIHHSMIGFHVLLITSSEEVVLVLEHESMMNLAISLKIEIVMQIFFLTILFFNCSIAAISHSQIHTPLLLSL